MRTLRASGSRIALLCLLLGAAASPSRAHFLWAQISGEETPKLQLRFTEQANEVTIPSLLERIKPARLWTPSSAELTLTTGEGALETALPSDAFLAAAEQTWGVLDKKSAGRGTFLLCYYAKAARNLEAAARPAKLPVEVFVRKDREGYRITVTRAGKNAAGAELVVNRPGKDNLIALKTDAAGAARFKVSESGLCGIRAMVAENRTGSYEGKSYELARHYSTLTLPVEAQAGASGPKTASIESAGRPAKADPDAWALLKSAHDSRYIVPSRFAGFASEVVFNDNGHTATGTMEYTNGNAIKLEMSGASDEAKEWLRGQLSNAVGHRRGGDFSKGDGKNPITFTPQDENTLLGRQVQLNDGFRSSYRVHDRKVVEVTRTMGDSHFTISVLETSQAEDGRYLPRHFIVNYFNAKSGALQRTDSFSDVYAPVEGVWLSASRRIVTAEQGRITARQFELKNIRLTTRTASK